MSDGLLGKIKRVLEYNPESGLFFWKAPTTNRVKVGDLAGSINHDGYIVIRVFGKLHRAHRLAIGFITGKLPTMDVDHIDLCRTNNRPHNLRVCSKVQNQCNRNRQANGTSGFKGVTFDKQTGTFKAQIGVRGKNYHLGRFKTKAEAAAAYDAASIKLHGEFSRVNQ